jgi:hypothetical protein
MTTCLAESSWSGIEDFIDIGTYANSYFSNDREFESMHKDIDSIKEMQQAIMEMLKK